MFSSTAANGRGLARGVLAASMVLGVACGASNPPAQSAESAAAERAANRAAERAEIEQAEVAQVESASAASPAEEPGAHAPDQTAAQAARPPETRTQGVIQELVRERRKSVRICYDRLRRAHPETGEIELTVSFTLLPSGKLRTVELNEERSNTRDPALVKCALETIRGITFPPSSRGLETSVSYPFHFKP